MRRPALRCGHWVAALIGVACLAHLAHAQEADGALVVERLDTGFAGERAGLQIGDVLTAWSSPPETAHTPLRTHFDLREVESERRPRQAVTLHGLRGKQSQSWTLGPETWGIGTKPAWSASIDARYRSSLANLEDDRPEQALAVATALSDELRQGDALSDAAWLLANLAQRAGERGHWASSSRLYRLAIDDLEALSLRPAQAQLQSDLGRALMRQHRFDESSEAFSAARAQHAALSPNRLGVAWNRRMSAQVNLRRGDLDTAADHLREALALYEREAPESLPLSHALGDIGRLAVTRRQLDEALRYYRRALIIAESLAPGGSHVASHLNGLAIVNYLTGDEVAAETRWEQSHAIRQRLEPDSLNASAPLHNIALSRADRGDFGAARAYYLRALAIIERLAPDGDEMTKTLNNLGTLALNQGDIAGAEAHQQRVFALRQQHTPDSLDMAITRINLGNIARLRADHEIARTHYLAALEIVERRAPDSQEQVKIWLALGILAFADGNLAEAETRMAGGLAIAERIAPSWRGVAESSVRLGDVKLAQGEPVAALAHYRRGLSIYEDIAPNTYAQARAFHGLARAFARQSDDASAKAAYERALAALEAQHARLIGTEETMASARARNLRIYDDYIVLLSGLGEDARAFEVLERSRAQVLSAMLAQRHLVFARDMPAALAHERRVLARDYERLQAQLYNAKDSSGIATLHGQMRVNRERRATLQRQLREQSPALADLQSASSISYAQARDTLPADTALLSFHVGTDQSQVFVITAHRELATHSLPLGRVELQTLVTRFRDLIDAGRWDAVPQAPLLALAADLYERLLRPVDAALEGAERVLIVPDGALHLLPFGALRRAGEGRAAYVAQWRPTYVVSSMTVYRQLRARRSPATQGGIVAFGDPAYGPPSREVSPADVAVRSAVPGDGLARLPYSREEVAAIGELYAANAAIYTGVDATEAQAKALDARARYVHFAAHGLLNQRAPLDTSIALATPDGVSTSENGFLQAWEVYEDLRLNADLVTLSGCETALGADYPGEGLIGLTRAFQYAGASAVLASLWQVNDRSTSHLMREFYTHINGGLHTADALARAQVALIETAPRPNGLARVIGSIRNWLSDEQDAPGTTHPYHWAGFVLSGASLR